jgi:hypothetical protein
MSQEYKDLWHWPYTSSLMGHPAGLAKVDVEEGQPKAAAGKSVVTVYYTSLLQKWADMTSTKKLSCLPVST